MWGPPVSGQAATRRTRIGCPGRHCCRAASVLSRKRRSPRFRPAASPLVLALRPALSEALPAERCRSPLLGLAAPLSPPLLGCHSPLPAIKLQRRASPPPSSDTAALRVGAERHRFFLGIAGARAARVAAGPPCCRAKMPPFSTGEHPSPLLSLIHCSGIEIDRSSCFRVHWCPSPSHPSRGGVARRGGTQRHGGLRGCAATPISFLSLPCA
jgi:hypothetical protein